jgi:hypothetical protein
MNTTDLSGLAGEVEMPNGEGPYCNAGRHRKRVPQRAFSDGRRRRARQVETEVL